MEIPDEPGHAGQDSGDRHDRAGGRSVRTPRLVGHLEWLGTALRVHDRPCPTVSELRLHLVERLESKGELLRSTT